MFKLFRAFWGRFFSTLRSVPKTRPELTAAEKLIHESKRLAWFETGVCEEDKLTTDERKSLLFRLANELKQAEVGSMEHAAIIARYNENVSMLIDVLQFHHELLPSEALIPDEYAHEDYLWLDNHIKNESPYNLLAKYSSAKIVAHIKVTQVFIQRGQGEMKVSPLQVFKGSISCGEEFSFHDGSWSYGYKQDKEYMVFWSPSHFAKERHVSPLPYVSPPAMEIFEKKSVKTIKLDRFGPIFWPIKARVVGECTTEVMLVDLIEWLEAQQA